MNNDWASKVWLKPQESAWPSLWAWIGGLLFTVVFFGVVPVVGQLAGMK